MEKSVISSDTADITWDPLTFFTVVTAQHPTNKGIQAGLSVQTKSVALTEVDRQTYFYDFHYYDNNYDGAEWDKLGLASYSKVTN